MTLPPEIPFSPKEFDVWNLVKQERDSVVLPPQFREGQIWYIAIGVNVGCEINGKDILFARPVLILRKFNKLAFLAIPLTTQPAEKIAQHPQYYYDLGERKGQRSCLTLTQMRMFSANRLLKQIGFLNDKEIKKIREAVVAIV